MNPMIRLLDHNLHRQLRFDARFLGNHSRVIHDEEVYTTIGTFYGWRL